MLLTGIAFILTARPAAAQNVEFRQISSPPGLVNDTTFPLPGTQVSTITAPLSSSGYHFTHWTLAGVRQNNGTGSGANPVTFTITGATEAIANYTPEALDSDGDTLPDWYEIHHFGSLVQGANDDFDGDGFTNALELSISQHPGAHDEREQGGVSRRRGLVFNVAPGVGDPTYIYGGVSRRRSQSIQIIQNPALLRLTEVSSPVGILDQTRILAAGVTVNLFTAPETYAGYRYTGWLVDGVRYDQPPQNQPIPITITHNTNAVARYISETADTDSDGIADWLEWYYYNGLQYDMNSDPDGDGLSWTVEALRGTSQIAHDLLETGGVSRRRGATLAVDTSGRVAFRLASEPATILDETQLVTRDTVQSVPDRTNHTYANYKFAWRDLDGARAEDASGAALGQFSFFITAPATATAHYLDPTVDTDGDGILDWNEGYYYGTLANGPDTDTDADGFSYGQEVFYSQSPRVVDTREQGGVSRRRGVAFNTTLFALPPAVGSVVANNITAPSARLTALVNPIGSATTFVFQFGTSTAYGRLTAMRPAGNGRLAIAADADIGGLSPDTEYHFRVIATNARGTTTSEDATFRTLPDAYDAWATTNSVGSPTADDDGDGLLNGVEFAFSLNPHRSDLERLPAPIIVNGHYRFDFHMPSGVTGVSVSAEYSTDLETWIALPDYCVGMHHTFTAPLSNGRQYVRWMVQFAP